MVAGAGAAVADDWRKPASIIRINWRNAGKPGRRRGVSEAGRFTALMVFLLPDDFHSKQWLTLSCGGGYD